MGIVMWVVAPDVLCIAAAGGVDGLAMCSQDDPQGKTVFLSKIDTLYNRIY